MTTQADEAKDRIRKNLQEQIESAIRTKRDWIRRIDDANSGIRYVDEKIARLMRELEGLDKETS